MMNAVLRFLSIAGVRGFLTAFGIFVFFHFYAVFFGLRVTTFPAFALAALSKPAPGRVLKASAT